MSLILCTVFKCDTYQVYKKHYLPTYADLGTKYSGSFSMDKKNLSHSSRPCTNRMPLTRANTVKVWMKTEKLIVKY